jgi:hypothetical protein
MGVPIRRVFLADGDAMTLPVGRLRWSVELVPASVAERGAGAEGLVESMPPK